MFPLYDQSARAQELPYITIFLIGVNIVVFLLTFLNPNFDQIIQEYGVIPSKILKGENLSTLLTSMFLHGGFIHLIGNMWFLWLFGDNVEHNLGPIRFLFFYLLVGILASLVHIFFVSSIDVKIPTIGASGAISGLLGGYVVLFPKNKIRAFMMIYLRPIFFDVPAFVYVGIWFIYQLLYASTPTSVAYMAHIGGFIAGTLLILSLRRKSKT